MKYVHLISTFEIEVLNLTFIEYFNLLILSFLYINL